MNVDQGSKLEGGWVKICKAGNEGPDAKLTCDDLDEIVRNYQPREKKAPIGVGLNWAGAQPYGQIDEVRRDGNYLLGKLSSVDPRMEDLHKAGAFKKKAVSLQKTPHGLSLERVGFLDDDQGTNVTSIDDVHDAEFRKHELLHAENRPAVGKFTEFISDLPSSETDHCESNAVSRLKQQGLWSPTFDAFHFPLILSELERKNRNAAKIFAEFLESVAPITQFSEGKLLVVERDLHSEARSLVRRNGLSYGEALDIAHQGRIQRVRSAQFSEAASAGFCRGVDLDREVRRVMQEKHVSYGEALEQVAADQPDLTAR